MNKVDKLANKVINNQGVKSPGRDGFQFNNVDFNRLKFEYYCQDDKKSEFDVYFRVLETSDEYFDYYRKRHGLWKMYGLNLPDEVLKKLYYKNALKLFPSIDKTLFE